MVKDFTDNTGHFGHELSLIRTLDAPVNLVWKAWTQADMLAQWWGPTGFKNIVHKLDSTPGGELVIDMISPDGNIYPMAGKFDEIVAPEKLVFTSAALDNMGAALFEVVTTVIIEENDNKTILHLKAKASKITKGGEQHIAGMEEGWNLSLNKLNEFSDAPFVITKNLTAPIARIWEAITDKDIMKKWYFDLPDFKPEVGCEFRFEGGPPEQTYTHICKVTEVIPESLITYSWRYEGYEGQSFVTFELTPASTGTQLRLTHIGLDTFPANNPHLAKHNFAEGWTHIIGKSLAEFIDNKNK